MANTIQILQVAVTFAVICVFSADATFEKRGIIDAFVPKALSHVVGDVLGVANQFWGKQENKKCYYYWGYKYSGPKSDNPERWNNEGFDQDEEGGLFNAAMDGVGLVGGGMMAVDGDVTEHLCLQYGMGYTEPQPGYPKNKPGSCPGSRYCTPQDIQEAYRLGYAKGTPPTIQYNPGSPPGSYVVGYPGSPPTIQYNPGSPPGSYTIQRPGSPPIVQYNPGSPPVSYVVTNPGFPPTVQYNPGNPPTQFSVTRPGNPPMCPCACPQG